MNIYCEGELSYMRVNMVMELYLHSLMDGHSMMLS